MIMNNIEILKEYEKYSYPAIILNSGLYIIYKNNAAKILGLKLRIGANIKRYADSENFEKLRGALDEKTIAILKLDTDSPIQYCVTQSENENITALCFYDVLNLTKDGGGLIKKAENIISKYNESRKIFKISQTQNDLLSENSKKIIRINEHFRKHMINLKSGGSDKHKTYCDIGEFLGDFSASVSQYAGSFGYRMNFNIENKMFYYMLNENDLLLINFILSAFALKHSVYNMVDINFHSDYSAGILRYEFVTENQFLNEYKDILTTDCDCLDEITDIKYLDLSLASLTAKNNDLDMRIYCDSDGDNKICLDLIFRRKSNVIESPSGEVYRNHITREDMLKLAETEFSDL